MPPGLARSEARLRGEGHEHLAVGVGGPVLLQHVAHLDVAELHAVGAVLHADESGLAQLDPFRGLVLGEPGLYAQPFELAADVAA